MPRRLVLALALTLTSCLTVEVHPSSAPEAPAAPAEVLAAEPVDEFEVDAAAEHGARSRVTLASGRDYLVVVSGTYSIWNPAFWDRTCAGRTEPSALHRSLRIDGPVGMDAAYRFAVPRRARVLCHLGDVSPRAGWQYTSGGGSWTTAPTPGAYQPGHAYVYRLRGRGRPLRVRAYETDVWDDNYGRLRVQVFE